MDDMIIDTIYPGQRQKSDFLSQKLHRTNRRLKAMEVRVKN